MKITRLGILVTVNRLYQFDMDGFRTINIQMHSRALDPVFEALSYSGLGQIQFALCLLFAFSRETRRFVLPLLITILVAGLPVVQGLKAFVERQRPSNLAIERPQESWTSASFPSGHTTTSFGIAVMLVILTWRTKRAWFGWLAILWAALVGVSRIYRGVHWPTDVIAGALAGTFSACAVHLAMDFVPWPTKRDAV